MQSLEGGCHCGKVRFRVQIEERVAIVCNCSICTKKGFLHLIVPPDRFELLTPPRELSVYEFNTGVAKHRFCRTCGVHPFYTPRSHPGHVDVNVRCLDAEAAATFQTRDFDGRHWEQNVDAIR